MNTPDKWHAEAECIGSEELFFASHDDKRGRPHHSKHAVAAAKRLCLRCPVIEECIGYVGELEQRSKHRVQGIWGGMTEEERADRYGDGLREVR